MSTHTPTTRPAQKTAGILTFLIADVRGYTAFTHDRGDEAAAGLAASFAEIAREGVEAHGGDVIELRGDEALAAFTSARGALRAAVDLQLTFVDEVERNPDLPLGVGIGLDVGEAVPVEAGYRGGALNLAARLSGRAGPGEVFASQGVVHLARAVDGLRFDDRGDLEFKGLAEPVRVIGVSPAGDSADDLTGRLSRAFDGPPSPRRPSDLPPELDPTMPMTGRDVEARRLRWWWRQARRGASRVVFIVGVAGVGKTRLAAEPALLASADGARIVYAAPGAASEPVVVGARSAREDDGPLLLVADGLDAMDASDVEAFAGLCQQLASDQAILVIGTLREDGRHGRLASLLRNAGEMTIQLLPLDVDGVREVVGLYADGDRGTAPVAAILEASGGVPLEVHHLASEWARGETARKLGEAATRAAAGQRDLRSLKAEIATNVIDLQLARERSQLHGDAVESALIEGTKVPPYKGLASFDVDDAEVFFGRERLVAEMVGRLAGSTLLGVVGPSGSGKSSAVRAGLVPALGAGVLPGSERWLRALLRPGAHPLRELDRALWASLPESLRARLEGTDLPLRAVRDLLGEGERIVVVVDQFEELFSLCPDEDERAAFVRALVEAASDPRGNSMVVLALGADYYGRCAAYPALAELLSESHVLVGPPAAREYRRAIEHPARRAGLRVEPALVDALVEDVADEPGALPLLSTALLELWHRRRGRTIPLEAYRQTGGVRGAVSRLAEDAYAELTDEEKAIARGLLLRLAAYGEGDAIVRRRVPLAELDVERDARVARVLAVLTEARLVVVADGTVEVAHEALLREWPRLRSWVDDDRAGHRLHGHLIEAAKGWETSGREGGELYRGARLAAALDWASQHRVELNELERAFVDESRAASEREADRQRRTNRRLRALLVGVGTFLVLAIAVGVIALVQREKAQQTALEATAQRVAAQGVLEDQLDLALLLARQAYDMDPSPGTRSALLASLLKAPAAIRVLPGTGDLITQIEGSADHQILAVQDQFGVVTVYDSETLARLRTVRLPSPGQMALAPDGRSLVAQTFAHGDGRWQLSIVNLTEGTIRNISRSETFRDLRRRLYWRSLHSQVWPSGSPQIAYASDGGSFVVGQSWGGDPVLVRYSAEGRLIGTPISLYPFDDKPGVVEQAPDGRRLLVLGEPDDLRILDARTLRTEHRIRLPDSPAESPTTAIAMAADGRTVGGGREDGSVYFLDLVTGEARPVKEGRHAERVRALQFTPDGRTLVTTGDDGVVIVWDVTTRSPREVFHGHAGAVIGLAFDSDVTTAFTAGLDGRTIAWDLTGDRRLGRPFTFGGARSGLNIQNIALSADGSTLAFIDGDTLNVGPLVARDEWWQYTRPPSNAADLGSLAFSPDNRLLAAPSPLPGGVILFATKTGKIVARWQASESGSVRDVAFTRSGTLVAAGGGTIAWWNPRSGRRLREIPLFLGDVSTYPSHFQLSPDETRVAVTSIGSVGGRLQVYDAIRDRRLWQRKADPRSAVLAWSPDGQVIATGGDAGGLVLWDAVTGRRLVGPARASAGGVTSVAFAHEGTLVVTAGSDGTLRLWDARTLKQVGPNITTVGNHPAYAHLLAGGTSAIVLSDTGKAWRWSIDPDQWAKRACLVANRTLTRAEWSAFLPDYPYEPAC